MEDQASNKRTAYDIVARDMRMLGSKADSDRAATAAAAAPTAERAPAEKAPAAAAPEPPPEPEITDEDVPF